MQLCSYVWNTITIIWNFHKNNLHRSQYSSNNINHVRYYLNTRICIICNRFYLQRYTRILQFHCKSPLKYSFTSSSCILETAHLLLHFPLRYIEWNAGRKSWGKKKKEKKKKKTRNSVVLHLPRAISSHLYVYLGLVSVHGLTMIFLNVRVYKRLLSYRTPVHGTLNIQMILFPVTTISQ